MSKIKVIIRNDRIEAWCDNELVGYVQNDILYGIRNGYAEEIGPVNHRVEITGKLALWRARGG